jgi:hypothetical protein
VNRVGREREIVSLISTRDRDYSQNGSNVKQSSFNLFHVEKSLWVV